ncbi:MAG: LysM peptidoglycan-binding domain-containing protein [Wenzhouxiangellaceae bacterium]|nr:LysM peptidoglycan-binding domain-containing protein [Wenzhouxiangellaceae bacterium]
MTFAPALRVVSVLLALLLLAGCATGTRLADTGSDEAAAKTPEDSVSPVEPSPSDPFEAIDRAFAGLALERQPADESAPAALVWPRIVERMRFAECPADSSAARWAAWYASNEAYMQRVFNRARPWMHFIVNEIEARDLPGELALLPVVESAFDPFAYSRGRAAGPWQFLSGTARDFGVPINDWYDGRRDFVVSTPAALDYLQYLNSLFDDWALAIAAYNAGQGRVMRAVQRNQRQGLGTEWDELRLPRETRGYVPKLKGLACLVRAPAQYAFVLPTIKDRPQIEILETGGPVDLVALSLVEPIEPAELLTLNAGLNKHLTPPDGPHHLVVPSAQADRFRAALEGLPAPKSSAPKRVRVQRGDTLSKLARRHDTTVAALQKANGMHDTRLAVGRQLVLPGTGLSTEPLELAGYREALRALASLQQQLVPTDRFIHSVRPGENLWLIARRYGVGVGDLQRMNGLSDNLIRPGQRLVIETDQARTAPTIVDGKYVVRQGDSLWAIARAQQVALDDLMRWNGLAADSVLRPGQELVIRRGSDA